ncbi:MAG: hypothetical protein NVV74_18255 [Magnetospirillum sp.]|nr:hypothetical protein [Magnetospirillum sp.]
MKVVLFCGGLGMRMRDYSQTQPKPMAMLRNRPLIWHVMRWYAHWGHKDFILCLGHRGEAIKEYFLGYSEALSNDFVLSEGGRRVDLLGEDIHDWRITFVDTGLSSNIGERLRRVAPHLAGEETFLANYSDGLTDIPLPRLIERHRATSAVATFLAVRPSQSFHVARLGEDGTVAGIHDVKETDMWINGGFFVLDRSIFDVMGEGEEPGGRAVPAPDPARAAVRLPLRRVLAGGGHLQGPDRDGSAAGPWSGPVGDVAAAGPPRSGGSAVIRQGRAVAFGTIGPPKRPPGKRGGLQYEHQNRGGKRILPPHHRLCRPLRGGRGTLRPCLLVARQPPARGSRWRRRDGQGGGLRWLVPGGGCPRLPGERRRG